MSRVTVLGGCGAVGSVAVKTLAQHPEFSEVVIGDYNIEKAQRLAAEVGAGVSAVQCDARDAWSICEAIRGSAVVLNAWGPSTPRTSRSSAARGAGRRSRRPTGRALERR